MYRLRHTDLVSAKADEQCPPVFAQRIACTRSQILASFAHWQMLKHRLRRGPTLAGYDTFRAGQAHGYVSRVRCTGFVGTVNACERNENIKQDSGPVSIHLYLSHRLHVFLLAQTQRDPLEDKIQLVHE